MDVRVEESNVDNEVVEFVPLLNHDDYEILTVYPFTIRRRDNHYVVKESIQSNGYVYVCLNKKQYSKHRLIAIQFIPNPNNYDEIDHINHDRSDNHIKNLRWISGSDNCRNRTSHNGVQYKYVDTIPDDAIVVNDYETTYERHEFVDYYFYNNKFYFYNGIQYRELYINETKHDGSKYVCLLNTNGRKVNVYYSKFKQQHDLI